MEVSFVLPVFDLRTCSLQSVSLSSAYSCRNNLWRPSLSAFFTLSLFRATNHQGHIVDKPLLSPAVDPRLRKYTRDANIDSGETLHSFRSGCTLTLAFSGSPLADIVSHVGWSSSKTAFNYLNLAHGWGSSWPTCFCSFAVSGGLSHLWRLQLLKGFCLWSAFPLSNSSSFKRALPPLFSLCLMASSSFQFWGV